MARRSTNAPTSGPSAACFTRWSVVGVPSSPLQQTAFTEIRGRFSPDGRWVAYQSNESVSRGEVYVASLAAGGGKWQISTAGGSFPRWRRDGAEIFYLAPDNQLMAASVNGKGSSFEVGAVTPLFDIRAPSGGGYRYNTCQPMDGDFSSIQFGKLIRLRLPWSSTGSQRSGNEPVTAGCSAWRCSPHRGTRGGSSRRRRRRRW